MKKIFPPLLRPLLLVAASAGLSAATKIDLTRVTAVPANETIPIVDFVRPSLMERPELNPSGTHFAALVAFNEDQRRLLVSDLKTQQFEQLGGVGEQDITQMHWLNDQRVLVGIALLKRGEVGLYACNVPGLSRYYPLLQYVGASLVAVPPADRLHPLLWLHSHSMNSGNSGEAVNVNTDIQTGKIVNLLGTVTQSLDLPEIEEDNQRHISTRYAVLSGGLDAGFLADKNGRLAFGYTATTNGIYSLHRLVGDRWEKCPINLDEIDVFGTGNRPGELLVRGPRPAQGPRPLQVMDAATGKPGQVLLQDKAYDFDGWLYRDPASHEVVGAVYDGIGPQVAWFTEDYRELQKILDGFFPGLVVRILGSDEARKTFLVVTYSDRQPESYYTVNLGQHTVGPIKNSLPWLDPKRMQPMSPIKFKTRDGRRLDAYVTMPAGASKANPPPLVVLPASDRAARNIWGFSTDAQFLASRGYAVLQPNHRGSSGSGWMFPPEDAQALNKMQEDVTDAAKALSASGLVDGSRMAIMGVRFGASLAVSAVANEPTVFRCAVAVSGTYDWAEVIKASHFNLEVAAPYQANSAQTALDRLGEPRREPEKFDALSPLRRADQIRAPLYLVNGEFDSPEVIAQAKSLESALRRNSVPCELRLFRDESWAIRRLKNRLELYEHLEAFLEKNLAPKPAA